MSELKRDFPSMDDYESAMKTLMGVIQASKVAMKAEWVLQDKIEMCGLEKRMEDALRILRLDYYKVQDALKLATNAEFCDECGEHLPHEVISCG